MDDHVTTKWCYLGLFACNRSNDRRHLSPCLALAREQSPVTHQLDSIQPGSLAQVINKINKKLIIDLLPYRRCAIYSLVTQASYPDIALKMLPLYVPQPHLSHWMKGP